MTNAGTKKREYLVAMAALFCALVASLAVAVTPAAAEEPAEYLSAGNFPEIASASAPEEYETRLALREGDTARQINEKEVVVFDAEGAEVGWVKLNLAHDADGTNVPTTLRLVEGDEVITTVHHREGNPMDGGAPFAYPISGGPGWEGGYRTVSLELNEPKPTATPAAPAATAPTPPASACTVPALHGLSLRAAKAMLRSADCSIGHVGLSRGATLGKGDVVRQARSAGTQLAAGTRVAVKLAAR